MPIIIVIMIYIYYLNAIVSLQTKKYGEFEQKSYKICSKNR